MGSRSDESVSFVGSGSDESIWFVGLGSDESVSFVGSMSDGSASLVGLLAGEASIVMETETTGFGKTGTGETGIVVISSMPSSADRN